MKREFIGGHAPFYGIRLRHAIALLVCLGAILILAGYLSVSVGQKAAFEAVTAQGRALTEALLSSAEMIIEADDEFINIGIDQLSERLSAFVARTAPLSVPALDSLRLSAGAEKVFFIDNGEIELSSSGRTLSLANEEIRLWLDSLEIDPDAEIIYEFRARDGDPYLLGYFPYDEKTGLLLIVKWQYGQFGNQKLSLYHLLNQVTKESGVEYILLQNLDGIIFASKKIASMPRITEDPFLEESLISDTTRSRLVTFQDREVLETVKNFRSKEFEGLFRVGLSLYGYRMITDSMKRQVWLVVAALIIIGMLAFGVVVGFQNFDILKTGLNKARIISQSLLDSIPGPVVAMDSDFKITDINAAAISIFGLQTLPSEGSDYNAIFPDDPFRFKQVMENKRSASFEATIGQDTDRYFITATPLIGFDGDSLGAIAIAQDITDSRKLEEMAESRRRLSELGALAASMAHEIRNPLNAIGITIQRMKSEIKPERGEEEYNRFIEGLRMEITRLNSIIEKFLSVARSVRPEITKINVGDLISYAAGLFQKQAEAQKINLSWRSPEGLTIDGDKDGLTQALVNVIKNSVEAVESDGEIEISVKESDEKAIISIVDDGQGIVDTASALKPFHTTKKDGTGLGLSTASKILADHGGELVIESSPGRGCRVDMIIPRKRSIG